MIPYGRQSISPDDVEAVKRVLESDWLTTGPQVAAFENAVSEYVGSRFGVAVSSGTAALHCAMFAIGIGPGDEVIVPPITFAATANCVLYLGARPVFADVEPDTLLMDPIATAAKITDKTRAIIAVDYAGQPCDYKALKSLAEKHGLVLVSDGCHALGASQEGRKVGSIADLTVFSFHPVKHITTGEGGMITTDRPDYAERMRRFRNHGIREEHHARLKANTWNYDMVDLGFNYRLTDFQSALGIRQLEELGKWLKKRQQIASIYNDAFRDTPWIHPLKKCHDREHAYHLYVILLEDMDRANLFQHLRERGIGVNVHYKPVYLHEYYRNHLGFKQGECPVAEDAYHRMLSLPIFQTMTDEEQKIVISEILNVSC